MATKLIVLLMLFSVCYGKTEYEDKTDQKFQDNCLSTTNSHRKKHHAPEFKIDEKLVTYAKSRCMLIAKNNNEPGDKQYGESRYWGASASKKPAPCDEALEYWYKDAKKHDYNTENPKPATNGFTQMLWKATTHVGCARCFGKEGQLYKTHMVCNYKPRGNQKNKFKQNVLKP